MVNVPDRAYVDVRLGPLKFAFCHFKTPVKNAPVYGLTFALCCWFHHHGQ
jgi:hypothetical protein